jgi:hypothetical protein
LVPAVAYRERGIARTMGEGLEVPLRRRPPSLDASLVAQSSVAKSPWHSRHSMNLAGEEFARWKASCVHVASRPPYRSTRHIPTRHRTTQSPLKPELRRERSQRQAVPRMPRDTASSPRFLPPRTPAKLAGKSAQGRANLGPFPRMPRNLTRRLWGESREHGGGAANLLRITERCIWVARRPRPDPSVTAIHRR